MIEEESEEEDKKGGLDSNKEEITTDEIEDYQLSRAVDLVRGVSLYESRFREEPMKMDDTEEVPAEDAQSEDGGAE